MEGQVTTLSHSSVLLLKKLIFEIVKAKCEVWDLTLWWIMCFEYLFGAQSQLLLLSDFWNYQSLLLLSWPEGGVS